MAQQYTQTRGINARYSQPQPYCRPETQKKTERIPGESLYKTNLCGWYTWTQRRRFKGSGITIELKDQNKRESLGDIPAKRRKPRFRRTVPRREWLREPDPEMVSRPEAERGERAHDQDVQENEQEICNHQRDEIPEKETREEQHASTEDTEWIDVSCIIEEDEDEYAII